MPTEDNRILKFNQYQISYEAPSIVYAYFEKRLMHVKIILKINPQQK